MYIRKVLYSIYGLIVKYLAFVIVVSLDWECQGNITQVSTNNKASMVLNTLMTTKCVGE